MYCHSSSKIRVIHIPGHTPDELAWYDEDERYLFVGNSFYKRISRSQSYTQAIIFPQEGSLIDYIRSLTKMIEFVESEKARYDTGPMVKIGCGHITSAIDGKDLTLGSQILLECSRWQGTREKDNREKRGGF